MLARTCLFALYFKNIIYPRARKYTNSKVLPQTKGQISTYVRPQLTKPMTNSKVNTIQFIIEHIQVLIYLSKCFINKQATVVFALIHYHICIVAIYQKQFTFGYIWTRQDDFSHLLNYFLNQVTVIFKEKFMYFQIQST